LERGVSGTQVTGHSLQVIAGLIITGLEEMEIASKTFLHSRRGSVAVERLVSPKSSFSCRLYNDAFSMEITVEWWDVT
jgi:hypothetical protein